MGGKTRKRNIENVSPPKNPHKGDESMTQEERILNLEKRMSTLERTLKDGRKKLNEIVDNWENVIFEFAETFGIEYSKSKQKE